MPDVALLAVPLAALAYLTVLGAGATVALAPRLPPDAQAALMPVVGAALVASASVLVPLGVSARPLAIAVAGGGVAATVAFGARVASALRGGGLPLAVALAAIVLAGAPSLARGDWKVTTLYGSTDSYHWSSQARAYLDGPAAAPASEHPDRVSYERSRAQRWAVALPFGLLQLAWLSGADPADVYGAFAAVVFSLLPLAAFAVARSRLQWSARLAAAGSLALVVNASLLFASHFSWQQQLAGSAFAFAAAAWLSLALEAGALRRDAAFAALFAAAALATYRLGFAPYLAALLTATVLAHVWRRRDVGVEGRRALASCALVFALLAAPSLLAVVRGLPGFLSSGGFSTEFKQAFPEGQIAEALGLVPRVWAIEASWPSAARIGWLLVASAFALALLAAAARSLARGAAPGARFLLAGGVLAIGGYCVLLLPVFASYLSFKILAYGTPFLALLAVRAGAGARGRLRTGAAVVAAALVVPSAAVATVAATRDAATPEPLSALPKAVSHLPRDAVIAVALEDPWEQAWAAYYLRERRLSIERPSYLLTAQGESRPASSFRRRATYVLTYGARGDEVWRSSRLVLARNA